MLRPKHEPVTTNAGLDSLTLGTDPVTTMAALALCDYCDEPWVREDTPYGFLCQRHYGYVELAGVILHPEHCDRVWAHKRGAAIRSGREPLAASLS